MTSRRFPPPAKRFVPERLDAGRWDDLEPLFADLERREIGSVDALESWLLDVSELEAMVGAEEARRYIGMTCRTDDPATQQRYLEFSRDIDPRVKVAADRLDRRYLSSPFRSRLPRPRYEVFDRIKDCDAKLFNEANVPLEAQETEVATRYTQIVGSLTVTIDGEEMPLARAALGLEEPDRSRREMVWRTIAERRQRERELIESIYEQLLELRVALARNAGFGNYRDLRFLKLHRFDYGVKECVDFHDAVRSVVVPRVREMNEERKRCLGSATLRPWDYEVDPFTQAPFRPFRTEEELRAIARELFAAVDPAFAEDFSELERLDLLDLYSRPNKAPGGYQYFLEDQRLPFIFANAAGTHEDVQTLLHEGGHAFHSLLSRDEPLLKYRDPPIEFCEVASMGMEFLGFEHLEKVYPQVEARRIRRSYLEKTLRLLTWIATIDAFQHWVYSQSSGGGRERCAAWIKVHRNFSSDTDWSGLESYQEVAWHRQGHLFRQPFYYIEYGIALIGALQLWSLARRDPRQAVKQYRAALALGGSRALPELFAAAGLRFEFGSKLMRKLVEEVHAEWRKLHDQERRG